jgi:hypothetical protein
VQLSTGGYARYKNHWFGERWQWRRSSDNKSLHSPIRQYTRNLSATIQLAHSLKLWWIVVSSNWLDDRPTSATAASTPIREPKDDGYGETTAAPIQWVTAMPTYAMTPNTILVLMMWLIVRGSVNIHVKETISVMALLRSRRFASFFHTHYLLNKSELWSRDSGRATIAIERMRVAN